MKLKAVAFVISILPIYMAAQGLDPAAIMRPVPGSWPTYNGDYSGRRFSPLAQINQSNVKDLRLSWVYHTEPGPGTSPFATQIKSTPLEVNGVLYFTIPDHAWARRRPNWPRDLALLLEKQRAAFTSAIAGSGIYRDWLFFETPDDHLVSLDKNTGKLRWAVEIADLALEIFFNSRSAGDRQPCHCWGGRRLARRSWVFGVARLGNRSAAMAIQYRASPRRAGQ